ncbi:hypothetical protein RHMOL_Rhmol01G0234100 [Rhododendron molle]|uniref:Uncharacterized protein n=1 Tax=Rhododendron molle TaxID=49168 RepID=A0ACC0Q491_RHOML|nr:hypothetical protein RHMOL_Rhmol01G0234100 [Rhododendron molle]
MVSLILPPTSKHTVVFTDKDLLVEGVANNLPLHIIFKCQGLWVPTVLIDNGSATNICPMRVAYLLRLAKKDFVPQTWLLRHTIAHVSYFVREVGNAAYTRQAEPFINLETGELLPSFEVFTSNTWSDNDEKPTKAEFKRKLSQAKVKTDWLGSFDQGSLELLFCEFS